MIRVLEEIQFRRRIPGSQWVTFDSPDGFDAPAPYRTDIIRNTGTAGPVSVYHVGYSRLCADDRYFNHVTKRYKLVFVLEGGGWFNGLPVRAGQGFLMFENCVNSMSADITSVWKYVYISFTGAGMQDVLSECGFAPGNQIFDIRDTDYVKSRCFDVIYARHPERVSGVYLLSLLFDLLSVSRPRQADVEPQKAGAAEGLSVHVKKAVKFMSRNYGSQIDVSDVAKAVHVSEKYLRTLIKRETGKSVREYLTDIRLSAAKTLISNSVYGIGEIALLSGFGEYRNFIRLYKKKYGMTPTETRNMPYSV